MSSLDIVQVLSERKVLVYYLKVAKVKISGVHRTDVSFCYIDQG